MRAYEEREEQRAKRAAHMQEKRLSAEQKARDAAQQRAYYASPEGRAMRLAGMARRRGIPVAQFRRVALEIGRAEAVCYSCGQPATQVDHVLPISMARWLGIVDCVDDYVAAVCRCCHLAKTKADIRDVRRMRRLMKTEMPES